MVDLDVISQRRQMSGWWTRSQRLTGELCGWREIGRGGSQDVQTPASGGIGIGKKKKSKKEKARMRRRDATRTSY